jgi:hypothetical protein
MQTNHKEINGGRKNTKGGFGLFRRSGHIRHFEMAD